MERYSPEQLADAMTTKHPPVIVDIAGPAAFDRAHLPHAVNIPAGPGFTERVREMVPETSTKVVLSAPPGSSMLEQAGSQLQAAGYRKVAVYEGDVDGWRPDISAVEDREGAAHVGPSVKGTPHLKTKRWKRKKQAEPSLLARMGAFARRYVPGFAKAEALVREFAGRLREND